MFFGEAKSDSCEVFDQTSKPKRGRKPKAENERRSIKFSIYLTPMIYEDVKAIASVTQSDVSSIINEAVGELIERNTTKIKAFREFLSTLESVKEKTE